MILNFDRALVEQLATHSEAARERRPSLSQLVEDCYLKEGANPTTEWPKQDDIDMTKIPAGLWLVGDEGIYLMSNGFPGLPRPDGTPGALVSYAREANPREKNNRAYSVKREAFGPDDGSEFIAMQDIRAALERSTGEFFRIDLTQERFEILG